MTSLIMLIIGCKNNSTSGNSKSGYVDSLSIIYTKDSYSYYRGKWESNRQFAITAKIMNIAEVYSYKDLKVEINYITETGTLLDKKTYTIYTAIRPLKVIDLDEYINDTAPIGTSFHNSNWKLLSATKYIDKP